ncbi:MAG: glycosyltransferase family 2 protein [Candidatus Aenigmarchaeota archaeon]|nr:glycosyltransferase family 2 protein [Candidatus Aenigmarchaeota archaeon]
MDMSIVIPTYREETRIRACLESVLAFCKKNFEKFEVIVVNDYSGDHTPEIVKEFGKGVRIINNEKRMGKGFAVHTGILEAKYQFVLFMDADLATSIEELGKFLQYTKEYDVVIASRNLPESDIVVKQPLHRQFAGKSFPLIVRLLLLPGIRDTQCGFKLFKTELAKDIVRKQSIFGFAFDTELLFIAKKKEMKIKEVPVRWVDKGESKLSVIRDVPKMFLDILKIRLNSLAGKYASQKA